MRSQRREKEDVGRSVVGGEDPESVRNPIDGDFGSLSIFWTKEDVYFILEEPKWERRSD